MPDPVETNPDLYRVVLETARDRALEYLDHPGDATPPHTPPGSVVITVSSFRRRLSAGGREVEVDLPALQARWLDAQEHSGTNIGDTDTHTFFVELKEPDPGHGSASIDPATLGPR